MSAFLVCGISGCVLDGDEERLLAGLGPGGVILFARNVGTADELRVLVDRVRSLPSQPYVAIDLEGGRVNRLERLIGALPSAASAADSGPAAVRALGEAAGAACAHFGIGVDFAPVVDVASPDGYLGGESRCLGDSPELVVERAREYLAGLERFGVMGCLKHFPGLGTGAVDSHRELPILGDAVRQEVSVFTALAAHSRAVMVAHALAPALGDAIRPASLSDVVVGGLRGIGCGPIIADDLEMGALSAFGTLPERAAAALLAGCDQVLVCNALDARSSVVAHLERVADRDLVLAPRLRESAAAGPGFGAGPGFRPSWDEVMGAAEHARSLARERA
jgi:beta-N-acetylhexosaminidase